MAQPLTRSDETARAARRAPRSCNSQTAALPSGHFGYAVVPQSAEGMRTEPRVSEPRDMAHLVGVGVGVGTRIGVGAGVRFMVRVGDRVSGLGSGLGSVVRVRVRVEIRLGSGSG